MFCGDSLSKSSCSKVQDGFSCNQKEYEVHLNILKDSNEITILADCTENRLGLRYTTSLINCHHKTQGFDAVCKSTANPDFKRLKP